MGPSGLGDLAARLLRLLNERVRRGEVSERRLARLLGYSQPHIHNVLHGRRRLTIEVADHILSTLAIPLEELVADPASTEAELRPDHLPAPWLEGPLGAGMPFPLEPARRRTLLFRSGLLDGLVRPFAASISLDEDSLHPVIQGGDIVLFDRSQKRLADPEFARPHALRWEGRGYLVRCRLERDRLLIETNFRGLSGPPTSLRPDEADGPVVVGAAVWVGRGL